MTDTAPTATPPADPSAEPSNPNELGTELSEAEEQAFVDEILGIKSEADPDPNPDPDPKDTDPKDPPVDPDPAKDPDPKDPPANPKDPAKDPDPDPKDPDPADSTVPDIKTDDLFIEIEIVKLNDDDEEVKETVKLTYNPNDPDSFIPDGFEATNHKQLSKIMEAKQEMANKFKERQAEHDQAQGKLDTQTAQREQVAKWEVEEKELVETKALEADKIDDVYGYMTRENIKRTEEGKPPITSFAMAFTSWNNDQSRIEAEEKDKKDAEEAKKKGALVGGGGGAGGNGGDAKIYRAGSARSMDDIVIDDV